MGRDRAGGRWNSRLGGWETGGILTLQGGFPYSAAISTDRANVGRTGQRPDLRAGINPVLDNPTPELWFDTRAYTFPALGTFGNVGRNTLYSDGMQTLDFMIGKTFRGQGRDGLRVPAARRSICSIMQISTPPMPPRMRISRADARPGDSRLTPNRFGVVTAARDPRILQFGLRFSF